MNMTDYLANKLLEHSTGKTAYTKPTTTYLALFKSDPTKAGSLSSEVSGYAYARTAVTWGNAASRQIANAALVETPEATGAWGTVSHIGIMDASTAGNMLYFGELTKNGVLTPETVNVGQTISFEIGTLVVVYT